MIEINFYNLLQWKFKCIYTGRQNIIEARSSVLEINCMLTVLCCKGEGSKRKVTLVFEEIENVHKDKDKKQ